MSLLCIGLVGIASVQLARAEVNVEGVSGLLTVPTAEVVQEGRAVVSLGRRLERAAAGTNDYIARSYSVTVGYLPGLEITARFADYPDWPEPIHQTTNYQDRSVSAKYVLFAGERWQAAVGGLDVGGESRRNEAYYAALTYEGPAGLSLSAGAGTEKLDGVFGGVRWTPSPYVSLVGEYDTEDFNYGLELRPLKGLTLMGGWTSRDRALGARYAFPLDPRGQETPCCPVQFERCEVEYEDDCALAAAVRDMLVAESFENVLVGTDGETLFVEFESRRFVEQLDALAVAAVLAATHSGSSIERLVLTPKIEDVPQLSLSTAADDLLAFLANPGSCAEGIYVSTYRPGGYPADTVFAREGNRKNGHGEAQLRLVSAVEITRPNMPSFRTKAGLGLEERVYLGRGLMAWGRQDWPFFNELTEKTVPVNRDAFLTYFDAYSPRLFALVHGGYFGDNRFGAAGEAGYYCGRFKLGGRYAYIKDRLSPTDAEDGVALGELAYYVPSLDLELTALGGRFMEGDEGLRFETRRYFGPTELTFFAYDTDRSSPHGGFQFFVPLPWYGERRHGSWRAVGSPYFGYQYRTDSDPWGAVPLPGRGLATTRQRLRPEYVEAHLDDFRRAAWLFFDG